MRPHLAFVLLLFGCDDTSFGLLVPDLAPSVERVDFGEVYAGAEATHFLTLRAENAPLLAELALEGADSFTVPQNVALAAGADTSVPLRFAPRRLGATTATLTVSGQNVEPRKILLLGSGIAPPPCLQDGASCDDGSACTTGDRCEAGVCLGRAVTCDDGVECTRDVCDPAIGCVPLPRDGFCADTDPCTLDRCAASGCENPVAPDGTTCGDVVACISAEICIFQRCVEVSIPEGAPCDDGSACTGNDTCSAGACSGTPIGRQPQIIAEKFTVPLANAASFVRGELYLSSYVDPWFPAEERVYKIAIDGARAAASERPIAGHAQFTDIDADTALRVGTSTSGIVVDIVQKNPLTILDSLPLRFSGPPPRFSGVQAVAGGRVFFCGGPSNSVMLSLSLTRPLDARTLQVYSGFTPCWAPFEAALSDGEYIVAWTRGAGSTTPTYAVFGLDAGGARSLIHHGFVPDGISRYGRIVDVVAKGGRALIDLENPLWYFVIDLESTPAQHGRIQISLPQPSILLGIEEKIAYFFSAGELRAVDLTNPFSPVVLPWRHPLSVSHPKLLASAPDQLVIASERGVVLVPTARAPASAPIELSTGGIDRLLSAAGGLIGFGGDGAALIEDGPIHFGGRSAPRVAADDASGPRGLAGRFTSDVPSILAGCTRSAECSTTSSAGPQISRIFVTDEIFTAAPVTIDPAAGELSVIEAEGCRAAGVRHRNIEVLDRCRSPDYLLSIASLPIASGFEVPTRIIAQEKYATVLGAADSWLVDLLNIPQIIGEIHEPGALILGARADDRRWLVTLLQNGRGELLIEDRAGNTTRHLLPDIERGGGKIIRLDYPLAWIAGRDEVFVLDLSQSTPQVFTRINLGTPAIGATPARGYDIFARRDGITTVTPICGAF